MTAVLTLREFATCFPLFIHLPIQQNAESVISKDLGLAASMKLMDGNERKGN